MIRTSLLIFLLAFLYFMSGSLSLNLLQGDTIVNVGLFAAEGIALAFALFFGEKILLGIFLGQFLLAFTNGISLPASLAISFINMSEAYIAIVLFKKLHLHTTLETFRDILGLGFLILFVLQPFSAFLSNSVLLFTQHISSQYFMHYLFSWWFGNVMGQLLLAPFLLVLFNNYKKINWREFFLYGLLFGIYIYTLQIVLNINNSLLLLSLSLPIIIIIVAYKGLVYGLFLNVLVSMIASYSVYLNIGAFTVNLHVENVINYNLFVLAHICIVLSVGILLEERKKYAKNLEITVANEVKKNQEQQIMMLEQSRLAQMGEMISMIAHQWRQPLNNLSLINQLLVSKYSKGKLDNTTIEYFKTNSKKQIELMSKTIDDFRNFFKKKSKNEEFFLNDVIEEVLNMTKAIYTSKGISITFEPQENYSICGQANGLAQVVLNILNNAKDALLEKKKDEKKIQIMTQKHNDNIQLSIRDNAGGIDENIINKIFDPYFSTKEDKNGTGLGLYMAQMIMREHFKTKIKASNDIEGANFIMHLPTGAK